MAVTLKVSIYIVTVFILSVKGSKNDARFNSNAYWDNMEALVINQLVGKAVEILCPYPSSFDKDDHYLCRGHNPDNCVRRTQKILRVNERKKHFLVHISDLSKADSGIYWCRSNTTWRQSEYTKVQLNISDEHAKRKSKRPTVHVTVTTVVRDSISSTAAPSTHSVDKAIRVAVIVCSTLLVVAVLMLIVFKYKPTWKHGESSVQQTHNRPNNEGDPDNVLYAEIQMESLPGLNSNCSYTGESSVQQTHNRPNNKRDPDSALYAEIQMESFPGLNSNSGESSVRQTGNRPNNEKDPESQLYSEIQMENSGHATLSTPDESVHLQC
ncbi:uncharacterized protein si:ch211-114l13.12 isoform X2 [Corythoichthys intestinalis]|uniref:uncharacterized protein si:ch211-114l13.12 isoform X2 n=1 Tax=Corythoichthys intestinalis TaxID=161448 RepID=UPI0025A61445|nr:uncharacterized protein si:ch211-114l13.12 isoform X2 [Corythoichthys intestinalis]